MTNDTPPLAKQAKQNAARIMSTHSIFKNHGFTGLDRIALSTSGNLQRTISVYYNAEVEVEILRNEKRRVLFQNDKNLSDKYLRNVILSVRLPGSTSSSPTAFGIAMSNVIISNKEYQEYFNQNDPGLGQFFQHFCLYPAFTLKEYGRGLPGGFVDYNWPWQDASTSDMKRLCERMIAQQWNDSTLWRLYELKADGVSCDILEILRSDLFQLNGHYEL